ncbi:phosphatidylserine decarboxylase [Gammaproteobacteria bacterium]
MLSVCFTEADQGDSLLVSSVKFSIMLGVLRGLYCNPTILPYLTISPQASNLVEIMDVFSGSKFEKFSHQRFMKNKKKYKIFDYITILPQYLIPHHPLSRLVNKLTRLRWSLWKNFLIRIFIRYYRIDLKDALCPEIESYPDFNSFFTRSLRTEARPIVNEPNSVISPVDAIVSAAGMIFNQTLFQAKGRQYCLETLLGGENHRTTRFMGGSFITLYLSPRDYHRIHMPVTGRLREMVHIPGRLFAVNNSAANVVPELFARNERVIAIFDTVVGPMALILVGALFVGSIETIWAGEITPPTREGQKAWTYPDIGTGSIILGKGTEMGRFNMGSTVIILFGTGAVAWEKSVTTGKFFRMGEKLGTQSGILHHGA